MRKREISGKKNTVKILAVLAVALLLAGCRENAGKMEEAQKIGEGSQKVSLFCDDKEVYSITVVAGNAVQDYCVQIMESDALGSPQSSFGLGSASFLKGRNVLVSLFVTTPESSWTEEEKEKALAKLKLASDYIEEQAAVYDVDTELIYDWSIQKNLILEADTDFLINENIDYMDRLDEEIGLWLDEKISYEELLRKYDAQGIATCIFVNNPGISYAIVYDGMDNEKESIVLFTGDYYRRGQEETPAVYAHEILHVFGAHDLYEDGEFTEEVTDYIADSYPDEIMYTVSGSGLGAVSQVLSPITAYHLGWLEHTEEIDMFPQLKN